MHLHSKFWWSRGRNCFYVYLFCFSSCYSASQRTGEQTDHVPDVFCPLLCFWPCWDTVSWRCPPEKAGNSQWFSQPSGGPSGLSDGWVNKFWSMIYCLRNNCDKQYYRHRGFRQYYATDMINRNSITLQVHAFKEQWTYNSTLIIVNVFNAL